jgi:hypothetical protein
MNIKSRKDKLQKVAKQIEAEKLHALVKQAAEETDLQAADSSDYSEKLFAKLLESIKIDGLED